MDTSKFIFDSIWDGFTKASVFYQNKNNVQYAVLSSDDTCTIPAAVLETTPETE